MEVNLAAYMADLEDVLGNLGEAVRGLGAYWAAQESRLTALEAQGSTESEKEANDTLSASGPVVSPTEPREPWIDGETIKDVFNDLENANCLCDPLDDPDPRGARKHIQRALARLERKLVPDGGRRIYLAQEGER